MIYLFSDSNVSQYEHTNSGEKEVKWLKEKKFFIFLTCFRIRRGVECALFFDQFLPDGNQNVTYAKIHLNSENGKIEFSLPLLGCILCCLQSWGIVALNIGCTSLIWSNPTRHKHSWNRKFFNLKFKTRSFAAVATMLSNSEIASSYCPSSGVTSACEIHENRMWLKKK